MSNKFVGVKTGVGPTGIKKIRLHPTSWKGAIGPTCRMSQACVFEGGARREEVRKRDCRGHFRRGPGLSPRASRVGRPVSRAGPREGAPEARGGAPRLQLIFGPAAGVGNCAAGLCGRVIYASPRRLIATARKRGPGFLDRFPRGAASLPPGSLFLAAPLPRPRALRRARARKSAPSLSFMARSARRISPTCGRRRAPSHTTGASGVRSLGSLRAE